MLVPFEDDQNKGKIFSVKMAEKVAMAVKLSTL